MNTLLCCRWRATWFEPDGNAEVRADEPLNDGVAVAAAVGPGFVIGLQNAVAQHIVDLHNAWLDAEQTRQELSDLMARTDAYCRMRAVGMPDDEAKALAWPKKFGGEDNA